MRTRWSGLLVMMMGALGCGGSSSPASTTSGTAGSGGGGASLDGAAGAPVSDDAGAGAGGAAGGDAERAAIRFDLPLKTYTFDSQTWALPSSNVVVSVVQKMDLKAEVPALSAATALMDVTISSLRFDALSTLNVDLPATSLFLAPDGVVDPLDGRAQKVGTVPASLAGRSGSGDIIEEPGADQTFAAFARALGSPFNVIASTTIPLAVGAPAPTGSAKISVTGVVSAKL